MRIDLSTTNFDQILTSGEVSVQSAFEKLDDHGSVAGYKHLPTGGSSNQILKNSGASGTGAWGTVTENAGALANITTISNSGVITNNIVTGTAPFTIASTTKVDNLNVDLLDGVRLAGIQTAIQNESYVYAVDSESSDSYVVALTPAVSSYAEGLSVCFKANTANTGACTLNVNGLGAKAIKKEYDSDPANSDIKAGQVVTVVYDGTNFQLQGGGGGAIADLTAIHSNSSSEISAITEKTALHANDLFLIEDSEISNVKKKVKSSNVGVYLTNGAGAPASTPLKIGDMYVDTTNRLLYVSDGTSSSANWVIQSSAPKIGIMSLAWTDEVFTKDNVGATRFMAYQTGYISTIAMLVNANTNGAKGKCAIYANHSDSSRPNGAPLAVSDETTFTGVAMTTFLFTFSTPYKVTKGTQYWLAMNFNTNTNPIRIGASAIPMCQYWSQAYASGNSFLTISGTGTNEKCIAMIGY